MAVSFKTVYTAAMALNNMGVSLVERGRHSEAIDALKEATVLLRQLAQDEIRLSSSANIYKTLGNAYYNIYRCQTDIQSSIVSQGLCVITEEEIAAVIRKSLSETTDTSIIFLIRMELAPRSTPNGSNHVADMESSIILYNTSNAFLCMGAAADTTARAIKCARRAFKLYQLSYAILENMTGYTCPTISNESVAALIPFSILVLQMLVSVASMLGMTSDAEYYDCKKTNLRTVFAERDVNFTAPVV
jgi:tetratricopeptide (TPR) repeat protein